MKVLIAIEDSRYIENTIAAMLPKTTDKAHFYRLLNLFQEKIKGYQYKHIEVDILTIGKTSFEAAFHLASVLAKQKYHLVLGLGLAGSLYDKISLGTIVNVINEKPFGIGEVDNTNLYNIGWLDKTKHPHQRGGFINLTNAYFNVFLPFYKVPAITVPALRADKERKIAQYPKDIESSNGVGIQYACLYEKANFYQLRAISYNLATEKENEKLAIEKLDETILQILNLL